MRSRLTLLIAFIAHLVEMRRSFSVLFAFFLFIVLTKKNIKQLNVKSGLIPYPSPFCVLYDMLFIEQGRFSYFCFDSRSHDFDVTFLNLLLHARVRYIIICTYFLYVNR